MKTAILYRSMTGHSKKIAKAIGEALSVMPLDIKQKPILKDVDLAFVVGGIYSDKSLPDMIDFITTLSGVKEVALITSSMTDKVGQDELRVLLEKNNISVLKEEYRCLGNFLFMKMGHPNKSEIAGAVDFAKKILAQKSQK